jgi:hypothetical protein
MKNRQLKEAAEKAHERGLAFLRSDETELAHEQFQLADWLNELHQRRMNPDQARFLRFLV